jgi:hypothetical protein
MTVGTRFFGHFHETTKNARLKKFVTEKCALSQTVHMARKWCLVGSYPNAASRQKRFSPEHQRQSFFPAVGQFFAPTLLKNVWRNA